MSVYTLNQLSLKSGRISIPRQGTFYSEMTLVSEAAPDLAIGKQATVGIDTDVTGVSYVGTITTIAPSSFGTWVVTVIGGAGQAYAPVKALNLNKTTRNVVIQRIMGLAPAEQLAPFTITNASVKSWECASGIGFGVTLQNFLSTFGAVWRTNRAGLIEIIIDTFAASTLPKLSQRTGAAGTLGVSYAVQGWDNTGVPQPGTTIDGTRIEEVAISFDATSTQLTLRNRTLSQALASANASLTNAALFAASWPATVTKQDGNTVSVTPDDDRIKGTGLDGVRLSYGTPLTTTTGLVGSKVYVSYGAADPTRPFVVAYDAATDNDSIVIIGDSSQAQFVALSNIVNDNFSALRSYLTNHNHGTGVGPSGPPLQPPPTPDDVAATKLKVS